MQQIISTLLLLRKDNQILLAKKKKGFGMGLFNGVGGKVEPGETIDQAMIRECQEEIHVTPTKYEKLGINTFEEYYKGEKAHLIFHLYVATEWEGNPEESEEMSPQWFNINNIPYNEMFKDDTHWLPLALNNQKFLGYFTFNEDWELTDYTLKEVDTLPND